jgi:hypothetical protein
MHHPTQPHSRVLQPTTDAAAAFDGRPDGAPVTFTVDGEPPHINLTLKPNNYGRLDKLPHHHYIYN